MQIKAAVLAESGGVPALSVEVVRVADPGPRDVLVRVAAAGVCHSDQHYLAGELTAPLPLVPGHEGAGVVEAIGADVTTVRPGDSVCLMWRPRCGECSSCLSGRPARCQSGAVQATSGGLLDGVSRLRRTNGEPLHHLMGVSCFAEYCVVSERSVVPTPDDVPPEVAAITGCAVITGVGAVLNAVRRCAGDTVAIFGAGGVGLSALLGALLTGAASVVVVDVVDARLAAAIELGATHVVNARHDDVLAAVRDVAPDGVDWAIEAVGRPDTLASAFEVLCPGGTLVAVGLAAAEETFSVPVNMLVQREKRIVGSLYGSANPPLDVPRLLRMYRSGQLPIDRLIGRRYRLDQVNDAFAALAGGAVGRGVLLPQDGP